MSVTYIGISGPIGGGKDTLADGLEALKAFLWPGQEVCVAGFSDMIKEILIGAFNAPREWCYGSHADKQRIIPMTKVSVREACQIIGRAYCAIDPAYWTDIAFRVMGEYFHRHENTGIAIFSDVRFPEEAKWIKMRGGKIIRLLRESRTEEESLLTSERALDGYEFDAVIDNRELSAEQTRALAVKQLITWRMTSAKL